MFFSYLVFKGHLNCRLVWADCVSIAFLLLLFLWGLKFVFSTPPPNKWPPANIQNTSSCSFQQQPLNHSTHLSSWQMSHAVNKARMDFTMSCLTQLSEPLRGPRLSAEGSQLSNMADWGAPIGRQWGGQLGVRAQRWGKRNQLGANLPHCAKIHNPINLFLFANQFHGFPRVSQGRIVFKRRSRCFSLHPDEVRRK